MKKIKENIKKVSHKKSIKKIIGNIYYHKNFYSSLLNNKRDVFVWMPAGFDISGLKRFPVLYMHDGQNLVNPKTSFAGIDWQVDETITRMIKEGIIEEIIVVGINNTADRLEEYSNSAKGNLYLRFIIEELMPFIDNNYPVLKEKENRAIMGSSMGGLSSFLMLWKYPDVFSKAACLSSSFYYDNFDAIHLVKNTKNKKTIKIYIDHGEDGIEGSQKMFAALTKNGYLLGKDFDYYYAPGKKHNEQSWAERLERPLRFLFGK